MDTTTFAILLFCLGILLLAAVAFVSGMAKINSPDDLNEEIISYLSDSSHDREHFIMQIWENKTDACNKYVLYRAEAEDILLKKKFEEIKQRILDAPNGSKCTSAFNRITPITTEYDYLKTICIENSTLENDTLIDDFPSYERVLHDCA